MKKITLYLKKDIVSSKDLNWLENKIMSRTNFDTSYPIVVKCNQNSQQIENLMQQISSPSSGWNIKSTTRYHLDQPYLMSPTGHIVTILNENNEELIFYKHRNYEYS